MIKFDDLYIQPLKCEHTISWSGWELGFEPEKTVGQNITEFADAVMSECWGTIRANVRSAETDDFALQITSEIPEVSADFCLKRVIESGLLAIWDNYPATMNARCGENLEAYRAMLVEMVRRADDLIAQLEEQAANK